MTHIRSRPCARNLFDVTYLFLDVDGTLLPFTGPSRSDEANPLLARLDVSLGRRLAALPCELVWATTWMAEANDLSPRLGWPDLPVVDWPDGDGTGRLHWKTRGLVEWAAGQPFVWLDDEITDADRDWVAATYAAPTLLHRVDAQRGLTHADVDAVEQWLGGQPPKGLQR